jgi:hypothetical protein
VLFLVRVHRAVEHPVIILKGSLLRRAYCAVGRHELFETVLGKHLLDRGGDGRREDVARNRGHIGRDQEKPFVVASLVEYDVILAAVIKQVADKIPRLSG